MAGVEIVRADGLGDDDIAAVERVVEAATEYDGVGPLSEHTLLHLRHPAGAVTLLARDGDDAGMIGFAHLDFSDATEGAIAELVVDPAARGRGVGRALLGAVLDAVPDGRLAIWAHGRMPAAAALAGALGFDRDRTLRRMCRPLTPDAPELPEPQWAPGIELRTFTVGDDEQAWLAVNARAFVALPDQGGWTMQDLLDREREPWFDPAGFFLAWRDGRLAGFHWTKVHGGDHDPIGEVYVVGVDPSAQGLGLGRALTLQGLHHLRDAGLPDVMLYVDDANTAAIALYESLGFSTRDLDVRFVTRRVSR